MDLDRDVAEREPRGHLLVHQPGCHEGHHFALAAGQRGVTLLQVRQVQRCRAPFPVDVQRLGDGGEQGFIVDRLGEKADGAGLHRAHRLRNVAMAADQDDWDGDAVVEQFLLEIEAVARPELDVEEEAR
jgi:hypothetical protein